MSVSSDDVRNIARLAQLAIEGDAIPEFSQDMNKILALVETLNTYDTTDVLPMAHPFGDQTSQRLRDDRVTEADQCAQAMAIAPSSEANLYLVPTVIENNSDETQ